MRHYLLILWHGYILSACGIQILLNCLKLENAVLRLITVI